MDSFSRRLFLGGVMAAGAAAVLKADSPLNIVVAGGHPGDPEYGCGGTVARYAKAGHNVTLLYLNLGEKGCASAKRAEDCGKIRRAEADRACHILGAKPAFASQVDGEAKIDSAAYDAFYNLLAGLHPNIVFTQWPIDNHRDHRATTMLVYDAWRRMKKQFALFYYEVSDGEDTLMFHPTDYVDITPTEKLKYQACFAHASQTPERFYALQLEVMRFRGLQAGSQFAEAFVHQDQSPAALLP